MEMRDFILSRFPDAVLVEVPPISRGTDSGLLQPGYWVVYAGPGQSAAELGRGTTGAGAWADAASRLQKEGVRSVVATDQRAIVFPMRAYDVAERENNSHRRDQ